MEEAVIDGRRGLLTLAQELPAIKGGTDCKRHVGQCQKKLLLRYPKTDTGLDL